MMRLRAPTHTIGRRASGWRESSLRGRWRSSNTMLSNMERSRRPKLAFMRFRSPAYGDDDDDDDDDNDNNEEREDDHPNR